MSRPPRATRFSVFDRNLRFPLQKEAIPKNIARIAVPMTESPHAKANVFKVDVFGLKHLMYIGQEKNRMKKTRPKQNDSLAKIRGWIFV